MAWWDTLVNIGSGLGDIASGVGQVASPVISWYNYDQYKDALENYQNAWQQGLEQGQQYIGQGIEAVKPFSDIAQKGFGTAYNWLMDPSQYVESPGLDWLREQGTQGIERSAAAKGLLGSGRTLKELSRFNQGLALQDYYNKINSLTGLATYANLPTLASLYGDAASFGLYGSEISGRAELAEQQAQQDFLNDLLGISKGAGQQQTGGLTSTLGGIGSIGAGIGSIGGGIGKLAGLFGLGGGATNIGTSAALTGGSELLFETPSLSNLSTIAGGSAALPAGELAALEDFYAGSAPSWMTGTVDEIGGGLPATEGGWLNTAGTLARYGGAAYSGYKGIQDILDKNYGRGGAELGLGGMMLLGGPASWISGGILGLMGLTGMGEHPPHMNDVMNAQIEQMFGESEAYQTEKARLESTGVGEYTDADYIALSSGVVGDMITKARLDPTGNDAQTYVDYQKTVNPGRYVVTVSDYKNNSWIEPGEIYQSKQAYLDALSAHETEKGLVGPDVRTPSEKEFDTLMARVNSAYQLGYWKEGNPDLLASLSPLLQKVESISVPTSVGTSIDWSARKTKALAQLNEMLG